MRFDASRRTLPRARRARGTAMRFRSPGARAIAPPTTRAPNARWGVVRGATATRGMTRTIARGAVASSTRAFSRAGEGDDGARSRTLVDDGCAVGGRERGARAFAQGCLACACAAVAVFVSPEATMADARGRDGDGAGEVVENTRAAHGEVASESAVTDGEILEEAWGLVNENFLPARKSESDGFDRAAWEALRAEHEANPPKTREEAYEMIRSMLGTLGDKFTRFIEPERFNSMLKYDITGVGLNIAEDAVDPERVRVLGMVLDSSAMKAGVEQDDEIVSVNGERVRGLSAFQVSSLIQEAEGKTIDLTIARKGENEPRTLSLSRDGGFEAPKSPVSMRLEGGHVGYVRLREFNSLAERDIARAIGELKKQGADAYILDLRDNPGGLVQAGVEIARLFLPSDSTIAYTEGRVVAGGVKRDTDVSATKRARNGSADAIPTKLKAIKANKNGPVVPANVPLIVLVNSRSASASEILTGALKDNCRATVVGSRTYGKGLIQSVYELSDLSGMVLTVGKYVTPSLVDIDQTGITPNFVMFPGFDAAAKEIGACKVPPKY